MQADPVLLREREHHSKGGVFCDVSGFSTNKISLAFCSPHIALKLHYRLVLDLPRSNIMPCRDWVLQALYNIAKVARESFIVFFQDVFDALFRLCADAEPNVQDAAQFLDSLIKAGLCSLPMCSIRLCQLARATSKAGSTFMWDVVSIPDAMLQDLGSVSSGLIVVPAVQRRHLQTADGALCQHHLGGRLILPVSLSRKILSRPFLISVSF